MVVTDDFWLDLPGSAEAWSQCLQEWGGGPYGWGEDALAPITSRRKTHFLPVQASKSKDKMQTCLTCLCPVSADGGEGLRLGVREAHEGTR